MDCGAQRGAMCVVQGPTEKSGKPPEKVDTSSHAAITSLVRILLASPCDHLSHDRQQYHCRRHLASSHHHHQVARATATQPEEDVKEDNEVPPGWRQLAVRAQQASAFGRCDRGL